MHLLQMVNLLLVSLSGLSNTIQKVNNEQGSKPIYPESQAGIIITGSSFLAQLWYGLFAEVGNICLYI